MCKGHTAADRGWLTKVRPLRGHHYHFHIRIKCPKGSPNCKSQSKPTWGIGCDEGQLDKYIYDILNPKPAPPRDPNKPVRRRARTFIMSDLPKQCEQVLEAN
jgi:penicillin-insensitive murein endopeptidase